jgi:hypothetical protein
MMELLKCRAALLSEILAHYSMLDKFFSNHNLMLTTSMLTLHTET